MNAFHVLANPLSGGGKAVHLARQVAADLGDAGATVRITFSPGIEAADSLVRDTKAAGEVCVTVGGDGFLGSLAASLIEHDVTFGIVPSGRGNDFARQLGIPVNTHDATRLAIAGSPTRVDAIRLGDRVVVGSVYAGIDSLVSHLVNTAPRRLPATLQYQVSSLRGLFKFPPRHYRVTVDDEVFAYRGFTAIAANSGYYGKGMHIAPDADVHDGLLDVIMVGAGNRLKFVTAMPQLYRGTHLKNPEVTVARGKVVRIEADDVEAYGDGEPIQQLPATVEVLPGALSVLL
ncbi:diacylglycerol/lipid kinase family protein [Flexivirga meconopsidis]|uniref:diacylglycerol/lipid kinase family protein n=1 Tax=Flexivirga meconopsidis TaxID=2977121 RepID=UPI0022404EAF|nr:diacylglycerol kinase family protein [Flexivirga meconopsidis]